MSFVDIGRLPIRDRVLEQLPPGGSLRVGERDLRIEHVLGVGSCSAVLAARYEDTGEPRALKVLCLHQRDLDAVGLGSWSEWRAQHEEGTLRDFLAEAELLALLRHPGVVRSEGVHQVGRLLVHVLERVVGDVLLRRLAQLDGVAVLACLRRIFEVVAHVHAHGIVHRDLVPLNVLATEAGDATLIDFGRAQMASGRAPTPGLGPATAVRRQAPDERAFDVDLHMLGCFAYWMLARRPVGSRVVIGHVRVPVTARILPIEERSPDRPAELVELVMRMIPTPGSGPAPPAAEGAALLAELTGGTRT